jgi:hypothetical protein
METLAQVEAPPERPSAPAVQTVEGGAPVFLDGGPIDLGSVPDLTLTPSPGGIADFIEPAETPVAEPVVAAAPNAEPAVDTPDVPPMADQTGTPYRRWRMPVAVLEGVWTGDNRMIEPEALTWRELPRSLMAKTVTSPGHDGARVVGRIDSAKRVDASQMVDARTGEPYGDGAFAIELEGVFLNDDDATQIAEMIEGQFLRGVSVDMADVTSRLDLYDADGNVIDLDTVDDETMLNATLREVYSAVRITEATITPSEAIEAAYIELLDDDGNVGAAMKPGQPTREQQTAALHTYVSPEPDAVVAGAAPVEPPADWFRRPDAAAYERSINITDEGRVFGLVAPEGVFHIGLVGQRMTVPHSAINYALFTTASVKTAEGDIIPTGCITVGTGHADMRAGVTAAVEHYDNTGTAVADIAVGEDEHGIWFSGALRPDVTPEQIRTLRGSKLSGDWRPWGGNREMVAVLAVNTPGFPVVRQLVASGRPGALVASFGALVPVHPELDEIRELLPDLHAAAERERRAAAREEQHRAAVLASQRERMAALSAAALRDRMGSVG